MKTVTLPSGRLGLELEAATKTQSRLNSLERQKTGIRIRKWSGDGVGDLSSSRIHSIDGVLTDRLPFREAVELLRNSKTRVIEVMQDVDQSRSLEEIEYFDKENYHERESVSSNIIKITPKKSITTPQKLPVSRDTLMSPQHEILSRVQTEQSCTPVTQRQKVEIGELKQEISKLKGQLRGSDGKVTMLKFQLEKTKKSTTALKTPEATAPSVPQEAIRVPTVSTPDKAGWLTHLQRSRATLQQLRSRGSSAIEAGCDRGSSAIEAGCDEGSSGNETADLPMSVSKDAKLVESVDGPKPVGSSELSLKLAVQERFNERLVLQMKTWVDSQVEMHRQLAEKEVADAFRLATSAPVVLQTTDSPCAEPTSIVIDAKTSDCQIPDVFAHSANICQSVSTPSKETIIDVEPQNQCVIMVETAKKSRRATPSSLLKYLQSSDKHLTSASSWSPSAPIREAESTAGGTPSCDTARDYGLTSHSRFESSSCYPARSESKFVHEPEVETEPYQQPAARFQSNVETGVDIHKFGLISKKQSTQHIFRTLTSSLPCDSTVASIAATPRKVRSAWKTWKEHDLKPTQLPVHGAATASHSLSHVHQYSHSLNELSPASFRDHMGRMRQENCLIRDDVARFRETLQRIREDSSDRKASKSAVGLITSQFARV